MLGEMGSRQPPGSTVQHTSRPRGSLADGRLESDQVGDECVDVPLGEPLAPWAHLQRGCRALRVQLARGVAVLDYLPDGVVLGQDRTEPGDRRVVCETLKLDP